MCVYHLAEFCLSCGKMTVVTFHPLFEGGLCQTCKVQHQNTDEHERQRVQSQNEQSIIQIFINVNAVVWINDEWDIRQRNIEKYISFMDGMFIFDQ